MKGAKGRWDVLILKVGDKDVGRLEISGGGNVVSDRAVLGEESFPLGSVKPPLQARVASGTIRR